MRSLIFGQEPTFGQAHRMFLHVQNPRNDFSGRSDILDQQTAAEILIFDG